MKAISLKMVYSGSRFVDSTELVNLDKVKEALTKANGRAKERLAYPSDVVVAVLMVERHLEKIGIPKNLWKGLMVEVDLRAQKFPRAYKWSADSTQFAIERRASGWFLVWTYRGACGEQKYKFSKPFTAEQEKAILKHATKI